jgi:hypothetical protein
MATEPRKRGRKVVGIDDPRVKQLLSALQAGNFVEDACDFAGIGVSTVYRWLDRGLQESETIASGAKPNKHERPYLELWEAIKALALKQRFETLQLSRMRRRTELGKRRLGGWKEQPLNNTDVD